MKRERERGRQRNGVLREFSKSLAVQIDQRLPFLDRTVSCQRLLSFGMAFFLDLKSCATFYLLPWQPLGSSNWDETPVRNRVIESAYE